MSNELRPCEDCGSKNIDMNRMECRDCGEWYGFKRPEEKPKIKLTKTLPSEEGEYYWATSPKHRVLMMSLIYHEGELCNSRNLAPAYTWECYWAKVEQDHFEFGD